MDRLYKPAVIPLITPRQSIAILLAVVIFAGLATAFVMYANNRYSLLFYGDAGSHLIGGRKLFDWQENPGWAQVGTVWLPLPHFLLMFPSMIDDLFFSGFAGLAVSLPCLALTSVLLYGIARLTLGYAGDLGKDRIEYAALICGLLYGLNPNFIYLGITAMTEAPFMLFFVGSAYYFLKWMQAQRNSLSFSGGGKFLFGSSILATAATLCRYEGWVLPIVLICAVFIVAFRGRGKEKFGNEGENDRGTRTLRERPYRATIVILISAISFSGIIFWLLFNFVSYVHALQFLNAKYYSAADQALNRNIRETLVLQPLNALRVYSTNAYMVYGPVLLSAALLGLFWQLKSHISDLRPVRYLRAYFAVTPAFTIVSLLVGIGEMTLWFNSRFVILLAPIVLWLTIWPIAKLPEWIWRHKLVLAGCTASLFIFQFSVPFFSIVVTLADAQGGFFYRESPSAFAAGERLHSLYNGTGSIMVMTGSAQQDKVMLASGIALKHFDSMIESSSWKKSYYEPWKYDDRLVVMSKLPDSDAISVAKYWSDHKSELDAHYTKVFENQYHEILSLKS